MLHDPIALTCLNCKLPVSTMSQLARIWTICAEQPDAIIREIVLSGPDSILYSLTAYIPAFDPGNIVKLIEVAEKSRGFRN